MKDKIPAYLYFVLFFAGFLTYVLIGIFMPKIGILMQSQMEALLAHSVVYLILGVIVGLIFPAGSWKLGIMLSLAVVCLLGFSLLFAGNFKIFLEKDLTFLIAIVVSSCLGSFFGAMLHAKIKNKKNII